MNPSAPRTRLALAAGVLLLGACDAERLVAPAPADVAVSRSLAASATAGTVPTLPTSTVNVEPVAPTGRTITVARGANLQAAINAAQPGDVLLLAAGATFTGNFTLPKKTGDAWITIRTSTPDSRLPVGERVTWDHSALLAKVVSPNGSAAIRTRAGAHHYRLVGLEIGAASNVRSSVQLVGIGSGSRSEQATLATVPHHIVIDRSYIRGAASMNLKNCVELHGSDIAVVNSSLARCHSNWQESHAIIGWNGPGPYLIENNYVAGAGINVMFGGADPASAELVPSDVTIRRNHIRKVLDWKGKWPVKNLIELKIGRRVLIEGNVLENSWASAQTGFALVLKTAVSSSANSWGRTEDVTVRKNVIRNSAGGVSISARDGGRGLPARRFRFEHNLWDGIGASNGTTMGRIFQVLSGVRDVQIEHNTAIHSASSAQMVVTFGGGAVDGFVFRDNVVTRGAYGVKGDGTAEGVDALAKRAPGYVFTNNVIVGAGASAYPSGNRFPSTLATTGFMSVAGHDYRLASSSPYKGAATDGTDPGADVAAITALTAGVLQQ